MRIDLGSGQENLGFKPGDKPTLYVKSRGLYAKLFPPKNYYAKDLPYFNDTQPILDIGCGHGLFIEASPDRIIGLDQNPDSVAICRQKGLTCIEGPCSHLPFADNTVGGVYCSHLIEHLDCKDAQRLVEEIDRVLKIRGRVIIKAPLPNKRFYDEPTHVKPYTPSAILNLFGKGDGQKTLVSKLGEYAVVAIHWDRELIYQPMIFPSSNPKRFWIRLLLRGVAVFLAQLGIRRLRRVAYTLVLEKTS